MKKILMKKILINKIRQKTTNKTNEKLYINFLYIHKNGS